MDVPAAVTQFLERQYPKPRVDPEWLHACYHWVVEDKGLNPLTNMEEIIKEVEEQLLSSNLRDSMLHGTGLPINISDTQVKQARIAGPPVLVEIASITDIGISAYNLNKVRIARDERLAAGEGEEGEGDIDVEGEGPVPNYPRSMLSFEISDGAVTLKAMEYKSLPQLRLGATPLGYKLMLKDCKVRRGIALLEPRCVTLKEHRSDDQEMHQSANFQQSLHLRLGLSIPEIETDDQLPPPPDPRSPLRDISPPPSPHSPSRINDIDEPRRRRVPNASMTQRTLVDPSQAVASTSSFFDGPTQVDGELLESLPISPVRYRPPSRTIFIDSDDEIELAPAPVRTEEASSEFGDDDIFVNQDAAFWDGVDNAAKRSEPPATSSSNAGGQDESMDVIDISEDEDKENMPVATRQVRRRVRSVPEPVNVIELSD